MPYWKIIAICREIHTKYRNTAEVKNVKIRGTYDYH
jgi:hypothetical protein